jgi:hypothetical protein
MHPLEDLPIYQLSQTFRSAPNKKLAWEIVRQFYAFYREEGVAEAIFYLVWLGLSAENEDVEKKHRVNMLYDLEYFRILNLALYFLYEKEHCGDSAKRK